MREEADSALRVTEAKVRSTVVSLDYATDRGMVMNRGGGRPTVAVTSNVRPVEQLASLGPPAARLARIRRLCGV
jgi:hypothetical protein